MKKKIIICIVSLLAVTFSSCTQYYEKQLEKQRIQDSIMQANVARQDSIKHAQDSIKHIQDSIKEAIRVYDLKHSVKITSAWLDRPNSACGVDANVYYKNLSHKTIKYLFWTGYPINAVGDRVGCEIRGFEDYRGRDTGPVKPGHSGGGCWRCAWYNCSARRLEITGIEITYMDGTSFEIKSWEIPYVWK